MSSVAGLTWTSRTEVCAELSRLALASGTPAIRARLTRLLSRLATTEQSAALRNLALDATGSANERHGALEALSRFGASLSYTELTELLRERPLHLEELSTSSFGRESSEDSTRALALWRAAAIEVARTPETRALVIDQLDELSAVERYMIARHLERRVCAEVSSWLFKKWLESDRHVEGAHEIPWRWLRDRPEARRIAFESWCRASAEERRLRLVERGFRLALQHDAGLCGELLDRPAELAQAVEELLAPAPLLIDQLGIGELERRIRATILTPDGHRGIPTQLRDWPMAWELLAERLSDTEVPFRARRNLLHTLWSQSYDRTIAWALEHIDGEAHRPLVEEILWERVEGRARFRERDRPFLLRALADRDIDFRVPAFLGLWGLEHDGVHDPEWRTRVETFLRSADERHVLHGHAALVEFGDTWRTELLVRGTTSPDPWIRSSAFELLGTVAATAHVVLFERELLGSRGDPKSERAWSAHHAARGLARAATPEALTALLRAWLATVLDHERSELERRILEGADRIDPQGESGTR